MYKDSYNGSVIPGGELERALRQASGRIFDSLTFNPDWRRGTRPYDSFQKETIEGCLHAGRFRI